MECRSSLIIHITIFGKGNNLHKTIILAISVMLLTSGIPVLPQANAQFPEGTILRTLDLQSAKISVAFDGEILYYGLDSLSSVLKRATTNGVQLNDLILNGCNVDAITFDFTRNILWASDGSTDPKTIYTIDPNTGICTQEFTFSANPAPCGGSCGTIDGISYDYTDDTLWLSFDQSPKIFHFDLNGISLPTLLIDTSPDSFMPDCSNQNSGIATGGDILYLAHLSCKQVFKFDKNGNRISSFFVDLPRIEDMTCDNITFAEYGTDALWVTDPTNGDLVAFAVDQGTCFKIPGPNYYPVKFHCGEVPDSVIQTSQSSGLEASPVKPGNYNTATDIYSNQNSTAVWKISLAYPGPAKSELASVNLIEGETIEIDCGQIRQKLPPIEVVTGYPQFIKGFVIIYATDLDVTATYTYREVVDPPWWQFWTSGSGASIDVETITPKHLFDSQPITIASQCPTPSIFINDASVIEGDSGTTNMMFTISLSQTSSCPVTVTYSTIPGSASDPGDYFTLSQTVTIPAGSTSMTINIAVVGDTTPESTETFTVQLSNPTNGAINDGMGIGTIIDDDSVSSIFIINGTKFLDEDSSHFRDNYNPEIGLPNWNVTLYDVSTGTPVLVDSMLTVDDPDPAKKGWFSFTVTPGNYRLCEKDDVLNHWETLPYPGVTSNLASCPLGMHPFGYDITITNADVTRQFGNNNTLN